MSTRRGTSPSGVLIESYQVCSSRRGRETRVIGAVGMIGPRALWAGSAAAPKSVATTARRSLEARPIVVLPDPGGSHLEARSYPAGGINGSRPAPPQHR